MQAGRGSQIVAVVTEGQQRVKGVKAPSPSLVTSVDISAREMGTVFRGGLKKDGVDRSFQSASC